ncbi:MAG TPA: flagellar basal-body MS-ring/collar protein FliF [Pseudolabrys sp.]|nr:flagellar basal-body MS-ring/collar protein FliF [Pseudolabrys sp.]
MQAFFDFVKSLGAARLAAMAAVTLALVGFFSFLMIQMTTPQMVPLFTDLSVDDSASIIKDLDRQVVPYQIKSDGAIIMVPKDKVARLRMKLAESGLPKGGGVGYEIFDKTDALGATTFVQNINHLRALEGELSRTIRSIDRVEAARVHLVLPERPLFSRDKVDASASIVLKVRGSLEPQQVRAIRHLVATAVNGLKPERVSVIDETGKLLADGAAPDNQLTGAGADERKTAYENRLRGEVENIVSSVVGPGHARVQINADFDVNKITQTSDKFDPDGRVLRSSQTREEQSATTDSKDGSVSVGTELPGGNKQQGDSGGGRGDQTRKTEEIVNYEISRTTKTEVIEAGRVNRISAAVLVDGVYGKNDKGEVTYQPRSKEEIDRITALVRSAIGFDAKRGDQVEVVNLRFAEPTPSPINEATGWMSYLQFTKDDIMGAAEKGVMALLGLVVLFMVVRPLVRRIITPEGAQTPFPAMTGAVAAAPGEAAAAGSPGVTLPGVSGSITSTGGPNVSIVGGDEAVAISNRTSAMIDIAKVQGQVHAQSVQKVGELADKNPHEAVSIIRNWLHEDAA